MGAEAGSVCGHQEPQSLHLALSCTRSRGGSGSAWPARSKPFTCAAEFGCNYRLWPF